MPAPPEKLKARGTTHHCIESPGIGFTVDRPEVPARSKKRVGIVRQRTRNSCSLQQTAADAPMRSRLPGAAGGLKKKRVDAAADTHQKLLRGSAPLPVAIAGPGPGGSAISLRRRASRPRARPAWENKGLQTLARSGGRRRFCSLNNGLSCDCYASCCVTSSIALFLFGIQAAHATPQQTGA